MDSVLIAVIDDEPLWLKTMGRVLAREGFRALLLDDAADALARLPSERPAVAILDGHMPGLDGVELARRLRSVMGEACPTLLLVTGDLGSIDEHVGLFDGVFQKPVPLDLLLAGIRRGAEAAGTKSD